MRELVAFTILGLFVLGCGCPNQPAEAPAASPEPEVASSPPAAPPPTAAPSAQPPPGPPVEEPKDEPLRPPAPVAPEPQFTDGMSVDEAIKAVPVGADRANIDQDTLSEPIRDFALYEPCKPGAARIKLKIAVWDGKAVGIDVASTPKNPKLVACIKDRIKGVTWQAHVKSLNTVEYSF